MSFEVFLKSCLCSELFPTEVACVGFWVPVHIHPVDRQLLKVWQNRRAFLALQGVDSFVDSFLMLQCVGLLLEACFAVFAVEGTRLYMNLLVPGEDVEEGEGLSADVTLVIPGPSVGHHVFLKIRGVVEHLSTFGTTGWPLRSG